MDRGKSVTANFKENKFNITISQTGGLNGQQPGTTSTSSPGPYYEGQVLTLSALPKEGYRFVKWIIGSGEFSEEEIDVTITGNESYTAVFEALPDFTYRLYMPIIAK